MSLIAHLKESTVPTAVGSSFTSQEVDFDGLSTRVFGLLAIGPMYDCDGAEIRVFAEETDDGVTWTNAAVFVVLDGTSEGRVVQTSFVRSKRYVRSRGYVGGGGDGRVFGISCFFGSLAT